MVKWLSGHSLKVFLDMSLSDGKSGLGGVVGIGGSHGGRRGRGGRHGKGW